MTGEFITVIDALKLNMDAVDEIQPLMNDLLSAVQGMPGLPADFAGRRTVGACAAVVSPLR